MKTFDPQAMYSEWMSQLVTQNPWQTWMKPPAAVSQAPVLDLLKEAGATIDQAALTQLQNDYMREFAQLWQDFASSKLPDLRDKRFASPGWHNHAMHSYSAASYLLNARFLMALAESVQAPAKTKQKIFFAVQQIIDAMSPANFLVTNPDAQTKLIETKGESLAKGITQMLADMQKGRISQTDESAFEVGQNVATTAGTVVFENRLFQLIQYQPLTKTVHQRPLLMVPPCINKFYILDLQPENSLVRYAVEQGNTVFLVSWANPDDSLAQVTWDDYVEEGAIKAIEVARAISGVEQINAFGFCVGGTIISTALAVLAARSVHPVSSLSLLTSLLDFSNTGILDVFVDEMQVGLREKSIGKGGLLAGRELASTFSSLRANDLVWNYVQANYLRGEAPPPFDLLYWNADSTNLPGPMFCWYLRNTYLENKLREPGALTVAGSPVDLGRIAAPVFIYGSREDHIVPWEAAFASTRLLNPQAAKNNRFILGASGHIAGVVNPPAKKKRSYWHNDEAVATPADWLAGATEVAGSWWPLWSEFLAEHGGAMRKAPTKPGSAAYPAIEPAPGRYVKVRAE
ncbi:MULTISPECIES: class I poly(R)-hydroxyalkanoic acid synthase [unclassified Undibacterium]|uniref:class I poly(R)-hydroxyalkanoic acid synthase n=1 Tax=unclassified Undibacterium TaxID=2630295 RepID=UPI002AC94E23|nr:MULTISPECIES: class I poly(R)-hydroxyalkanoic acid synthase [unclassified Undibacterium]MEB0141158.1 class I poly(R)-hydroxyalkanoic acid synthase [Undibacterium sp. CCC2.1]MEB0174191.1 class I poly(R)-hydroxyalkanoic acid synthase [Undibacterium sp. CCC1.1]MEB0178131.1 class I poly(R)-hydroxyalkanoic acid synthase [Undibacterium sp. CCC3.4]MEB0217336.1 class I poly(R)-hydroxyalkanoic acid synthase [Undibacterium sp. 5I2]WPX43271.1 class I poly(R)-hydroxyalkanoic acid synthase [Undibacteriu